jgi:hypothetical protein
MSSTHWLQLEPCVSCTDCDGVREHLEHPPYPEETVAVAVGDADTRRALSSLSDDPDGFPVLEIDKLGRRSAIREHGPSLVGVSSGKQWWQQGVVMGEDDALRS